jgi:HSP20 family molecular chaperone IbpA
MFITMFLPGPSPGRFLPPGGITARMLLVIRRELRVDVQQHDDEVIVVADLHSVEEEDVSLQILNE